MFPRCCVWIPVALLACSDGVPSTGEPVVDGGGDAGDVGLADAGPDAGTSDAGIDAGNTIDAGIFDAGFVDAGVIDAGDVVNPTALCAMPDMPTIYGTGLIVIPPNPYSSNGKVPAADACVQGKHDTIIILGCPSNTDGTPSGSQIARIQIALSLRDAGLGDTFIVTGGAIHNQWVEADSLRTQLLEKGVPDAQIIVENRAAHTDENIYFSDRIMEARGWESAMVVSDDPGQLILTAVCDSNCCVDRGRLTVLDFPVPGHTARVGHYARFPWGGAIAADECTEIKRPARAMCTQLSSRLSCKADFRLSPP